MLTASAYAPGVHLYDGRGLSYERTRRTRPDTVIFTPSVRDVVALIAARPLKQWRYWHTKFNLVRAHQKPRSIVRDWTGMLDTAEDSHHGLADAWERITTIHEWCQANGMKRHTTAGAIGIALLTDRFSPNFTPLYARVKDEEAIRPALYGGRCQTFEDQLDDNHEYRGPIIYYDANGAYLDVIRSVAMPYPYRYLPYPNLRAEGVTDCTIEEPGKYPVLPHRDYFYTNRPKRGAWTNREIRRALDYGAKLKRVHGGLHYVRTTLALQPLGDWLAEQREKHDGTLRALFKKIPNAMIGRFASPPTVCLTKYRDGCDWRRHPRLVSAVSVHDGIMSVEITINKRAPWYASAWSAAILAEQRLRLHELITSLDRNGYNVLYCDTDGVMLGTCGNEYPITSSAVGGYKIEWEAERVYIHGTKAYVANTGAVKKAGARRDLPVEKRFGRVIDFAREPREIT